MLGKLLALCWVDISNPAGISTMVILLSLVKKRSHALAYIIGAYVGYVACCAAVYFGVEKLLAGLLERIVEQYPSAVGITAVAVSAGCAIGFIFSAIYLVKVIKKEKEFSLEGMLNVRFVHPAFLFILALGQSVIDMPYCFPALAYIGLLVSEGVGFAAALPYLALFCTVAELPLLLIYYLSVKLEGERFNKVIAVIKRVFSVFCSAAIPVLLAIAAFWLMQQGIALL